MPDIKNRTDYEDYEQYVASFIKREGLSHLSTSTEEIVNGQGDGNQDPWFSRSPCPCCGSSLGGNREYLYARNSYDAIVRFTICEDCVYYVNYGRLDDRTMERVNLAA